MREFSNTIDNMEDKKQLSVQADIKSGDLDKNVLLTRQ